MSEFLARLMAPKQLVFERIEHRAPGPHEVSAKTLYSAISAGTELAAFDGLPPLSSAPAYPRLMGYCNIARIEAVGAEVREHSVGELIDA